MLLNFYQKHRESMETWKACYTREMCWKIMKETAIH